ncbi:hypothetical protein JY651_08815 [Pyxidicoccus parkwayensis]|uniref:Uncharacterized protein n=1 Tax=Pyxidicoccus parkwayensis TaxID=2813578 RepID=A0ABX7P3K5_9BACT|nr:hypothetical protein [Pyxidicoccus parkwaysis]QSQ25016.1 hypothetical protein JY651_08815 [Pyxidicoccus parkwaysis]
MRRKQRERIQESGWEVIQRSLDSYQPERIAALLREYLTPRIPSGVRKLDEPLREQLRDGVEAIVDANLGPWYHETGVHLGNEIIGGFCWCHRFFNQKPAPNLNVEFNVQLMVDAIGRGHAWLSALDKAYRGAELLEDPDEGIRQLGLSDAVVRAIEITVDATATEDAWYGYAWDAVSWLLQARGVPANHEVRKAMRQTLGKFESWVGPSEDQTRAAGDAVALAAVKTGFNARYP